MTRDIHVLHVDDSAALRDLTAEYLEKVASGVTVHSLADPTEVLPTVERDDVDCVVSDYEMPEQDGLELCRDVRAEHPDLPFFLFTSRGGEELIRQAMAAGATDYIQKEPGLEQYTLLANRITNAVAHHRVERRLAELERAVDEGEAGEGAAPAATDGGRTRSEDAGDDLAGELDPVGGLEY